MANKSLFDLLIEDLDQQAELGGGSKPPAGYGSAFIDPAKGEVQEGGEWTVEEAGNPILELCLQAAEMLGIDPEAIKKAKVESQGADHDFVITGIQGGIRQLTFQETDHNTVEVIVPNSGSYYELPVPKQMSYKNNKLSEGADMEAIERMDGLVGIGDIEEFIGAARNMIRDLKLDGFHDDDIYAYFDYHLRNSIND